MNPTHIKPIRTEEDYQAAMARIDALMNATKTTGQGDELEVLAVLADDWENRTFKRAPISRTDMLNALIDARGAKPSDLVETVGALGRVYQLINGTRKVSDEMAFKLAEYFGVSVQTFDLPASLLAREASRRAS